MTVKQLAMQTARYLRKNQTKTEALFWQSVRDKKFLSKKFRRQHPLFYKYCSREKFFIADFYCPELNLVIEIDGGVHEQQKEYDQIRSEILEVQHNLNIKRFKNEEILKDIDGVLEKLKLMI